jgi:ribosomal protein S18 acetylase RimI-like enzyme
VLCYKFTMGNKLIRSIKPSDKKDWQKLYCSYAAFYKVEMNQDILDTVWNWLEDEKHELNGLVCEFEEKIVALAHYRRVPSPLRGKNIGFLDDLFVSPDFRGLKIGEKIISTLKNISSENGWGLIRWITRSDNLRAKSLYDKISKKTNWEMYEL